MKRKSLWRSGAVLLVLAFALALVPVLNSAERAPRTSFRLLMRPALVMTVLYPWLGQDPVRTPQQPKTSTPSKGRVRPTNDLSTVKPGIGD